MATSSTTVSKGTNRSVLSQIRDHFGDQCHTIEDSSWDNIYVVGDVHGCAAEFLELIKKIDLSDSELLVCVGDLIRKGPDSAGAVNIVRNRSNVLSVLGNGEFDYLRGDKEAPQLGDVHRSAIETWPVTITWTENVVVHGGFDPDKAIEEHTPEDVVNMRAPKQDNNYETPFWFDQYGEETRIFFGHTATQVPIVQNNAVALDTGCVYGGELTAYDTRNDELISVAAHKTYVPREDHKYADVTRGDH